MKGHPILFSAPMVRALLAGTKTQTRRIIDVDHAETKNLRLDEYGWLRTYIGDVTGEGQDIPEAWAMVQDGWENGMRCQYGSPGDRLWVRETITVGNTSVDDATIGYPANGSWREVGPSSGDVPDDKLVGYFKMVDKARKKGGKCSVPSIHMPRWASRITLEITEVRVQRLQEISVEDIIAEGLSTRLREHDACHELRAQWQTLWASVKGPESLAANPWVWALTFRRVAP